METGGGLGRAVPGSSGAGPVAVRRFSAVAVGAECVIREHLLRLLPEPAKLRSNLPVRSLRDGGGVSDRDGDRSRVLHCVGVAWHGRGRLAEACPAVNGTCGYQPRLPGLEGTRLVAACTSPSCLPSRCRR